MIKKLETSETDQLLSARFFPFNALVCEQGRAFFNETLLFVRPNLWLYFCLKCCDVTHFILVFTV